MPSRFSSLAMYAVDLIWPIVPVSRPIIESSAKMYSRVMRSPGVIAAVVGWGACLRGSSCATAATGSISANTSFLTSFSGWFKWAGTYRERSNSHVAPAGHIEGSLRHRRVCFDIRYVNALIQVTVAVDLDSNGHGHVIHFRELREPDVDQFFASRRIGLDDTQHAPML